MKKKLLICFMLLIMVITLTGCKKANNGNNTKNYKTIENKLECTHTEGETVTTLLFTYDEDNIKRYEIVEKTDLKEEEAARKLNEKISDEIRKDGKLQGVHVVCRYENTSVTKTITIDVDLLDDESKKYYKEQIKEYEGLSNSKIKDKLEKASYTCVEK